MKSTFEKIMQDPERRNKFYKGYRNFLFLELLKESYMYKIFSIFTKKIKDTIIIATIIAMITACSYSKVTQKTSDITITGRAITKIEAKISAEKKAAVLLGKFTYVKDSVCVQEDNTGWACTIYVEKFE